MAQNELDEKVLSELGLSDLSDEEKAVMLKLLDDRLEKRFIANLLKSMPEEKRQDLEKKVEAMEKRSVESVLEAAINIHPDVKGVLEKSAQEIVDEMKASTGKPASEPAVGGSQIQSDGEGFPPSPPAEPEPEN